MSLTKKLAAEFLGTFWLVLGGCGSAVLAAHFGGDGNPLGIGFLGVALAFGLTVLTGAYAFGHISGGHFNPAVSVGLWAGGRFSAKELLPYVVAQVAGGIAAGFILWQIASGQPAFAVDSTGRPRIARFTLSGGRLAPFHPRQAVGGHPVLTRDSVVVADVDTSGSASFIARNPRTAVGIAKDGRRLLLAVIDGRQKGYSDGMSLRETAVLMLALGARDALNLDGGGSSTLVYTDSAGLHLANHPSDAGGERTVGDALAVVSRCR